MFPKEFVWGAATSSYQIEGNVSADGKGVSVWDTFSKQSGVVSNNENGDVACDHYKRFKDDVKIMKEIGLSAYRFSISWTRVLPKGTGIVNQKGLQFYSDLVDELLENGITPYVTLFHWDYPEKLMQRGGWLNRECVEWFEEYTRVIVECLSDRVEHWITINEPQCFVKLGYEEGIHAPGMRVGKRYVFEVAHNMLLAHGKAVQTIRKYAKKKPMVGFAPALNYVMPDSGCPEAMEKAKEKMFGCHKWDGIWSTSWWTEPIYNGRYPEDGLKEYAEWLPEYTQEDMKLINQPLDFFGVNYYHAARYSGKLALGYAETAVEWPIEPEGFYYMTKFLYEKYGVPLLITENGMANMDWVLEDGCIHDVQRIDYVSRHLKNMHKAICEGVEILGYMYWSLMDNFEWQNGYRKRFGLVYVNYETQERILKDSAYWYKKIIETNGASLEQI